MNHFLTWGRETSLSDCQFLVVDFWKIVTMSNEVWLLNERWLFHLSNLIVGTNSQPLNPLNCTYWALVRVLTTIASIVRSNTSSSTILSYSNLLISLLVLKSLPNQRSILILSKPPTLIWVLTGAPIASVMNDGAANLEFAVWKLSWIKLLLLVTWARLHRSSNVESLLEVAWISSSGTIWLWNEYMLSILLSCIQKSLTQGIISHTRFCGWRASNDKWFLSGDVLWLLSLVIVNLLMLHPYDLTILSRLSWYYWALRICSVHKVVVASNVYFSKILTLISRRLHFILFLLSARIILILILLWSILESQLLLSTFIVFSVVYFLILEHCLVFLFVFLHHVSEKWWVLMLS